MGFELFCMGLIALLFGLTLAFLGYKLMWIMLPIFGFFFGLGLGAQTVQVIFGGGFFATITSWMVGFVVGAIFAALSYLFYFLAVAILSGAFGYGVTVALLTAIGMNMNFLVWLIAIIVGVVVAVVVLRFNLQKWAVIIVTAIGGTGVIIFTLLAAFGQLSFLTLMMDPVRMAIQNSWIWLIFFLVVAGGGIWFQFVSNRDYEIEEYNRYASMG
jgi:hypothetical protein